MNDVKPESEDQPDGRVVGEYQLIESLGEGGLGEAFTAKHTQTGAPVVVKLLHAERVGDADAMQAYFDELRAVASLEHPGVVPVIDTGWFESQPYVVMKELEGQALDMELEDLGLLPPARALAGCKQIAEAMSAVHAAGLVHGDLTSANVFIASRDGGEAFEVFDFASRHLPPAADPSVYLAPEQYGDGFVDPHTDIYSLGILLYEMLTARVPFGDTNEEEAKAGHLGQLPAPPSQIVRNITPHVQAVCLKALEKDPDDRYASMDELAAALADPQAYVDANGGLGGFLSGGSTLVLPGEAAPAAAPSPVPAPVSMAKTMMGIAPIDVPPGEAAPSPDLAPTQPVAALDTAPLSRTEPAPAPAPAPSPSTASAQTVVLPPTGVPAPALPAQPAPAQPVRAAAPRPQAAPPMPPADITDELDFPPKSRAPLIAVGVGAVVVIVAVIVLMSGGDKDKDNDKVADEAAGTTEPAVAANAAPTFDAAPAVEPPAVVAMDAAPAPVPPPEPAMVVLSVETDPPGAEVFVEGEPKSRGSAPVRIELRQGTQAKLIAKKRGYETATKTVTADDHGTVSLALTAEKVVSKADRADNKRPKKERSKRRSKRRKKKHGRDDLLPPKL